MHGGVREAHPCQFGNRKYVEEGERERERRTEEKKGMCRVRYIRTRTDGGGKKNSKEEEEKKDIEIQREIKSDAVKETEVVGWVRE